MNGQNRIRNTAQFPLPLPARFTQILWASIVQTEGRPCWLGGCAPLQTGVWRKYQEACALKAAGGKGSAQRVLGVSLCAVRQRRLVGKS